MAFQIQRTQRSRAPTGGGSQANVDVSTGGQQVARAIGTAAQAVQEGATILHKLQAENQLSEAKRLMQERLNVLADDFERNPDSITYQQRFDEAMGEMKAFTPKNALAARGYGHILANTRVSGNGMVMRAQLASERDLKKANIADMISRGSYTEARKAIQSGLKDGTIDTATEAQKMMADVDTQEQQGGRNARLELELQNARTFGSEDDAMDYVDGLIGTMPTADVNALRSIVSADHARRKETEKQEKEALVEGYNDDMIDGVVGAGQYEDKPYDVTKVLKDKRLTIDEKNEVLDNWKKANAILVPEESDFNAVERLEAAIDAFATGRKVTVDGIEQVATRDHARNVLASNLHLLDATDRKKYRNDIYGAQDAVYSTNRTDGRNFLKATLLTGVSALGVSIPVTPEQKVHFNDAIIELNNKLNDWRTSGQWPSPVDFYRELKLIEAKVKSPGYRVGQTDAEGVALQAVLGSIPGASVPRPSASRAPGNDPIVFPYIQQLKRQGGFPSDGEEFIKVQLSALTDIWPELNDISKRDAIDKILENQTITDIGQRLRNAYRKQN